MDAKKLHQLYSTHSNISRIVEKLKKSSHTKLQLKGLVGSSKSLMLAACFSQYPQTTLALLSDRETAAYFYNDLVNALTDKQVVFFPSSYKRTVNNEQVETENLVLRTDVLNRINQSTEKLIIVTYPEAVAEKVVSKNYLESNTLTLKNNQKIAMEKIVDFLNDNHFERTDFVYEPSQYSIRGSILDVFSFGDEQPFRIDFFGDEIDSIRSFDSVSQLSISKLARINIIPNIQKSAENRVSFFDFVPQDAICWGDDIRFLLERTNDLYENTLNNQENNFSISEVLTTKDYLQDRIRNFRWVEFANRAYFESDSYEFKTTQQPDFNKNFDFLGQNICEKNSEGYTTYILTEDENQIQRLKSIFEGEDIKRKVVFTPILNTLHEGFIEHELKICCYTDHQIFERYHKFVLKNSSVVEGRETLTLKELNDLHPGDYVVHVDHGIGQFAGLTKIELNGKMQECLAIKYQDNDILYASVYTLHRISKYRDKDGDAPKIHKLGSAVWSKMTQKTKSKVKDIAKELIELYARRKAQKGFAFSADSYLQQELEASFIYQDTPDQRKSTRDVKRDMEKEMPMDRLICGDVGFGKTEIAIRAAFKAVADSKQVAVLVPTTILALQHYKTFSERLKNFPCKVAYISRSKTAKEEREIVEELQNGRIDILIGTHRIVSQDIKFKDLGLLIVDEEQKFGVEVKEKLKRMKINVDTLTMTATPIPRTMQFSLLGARDLSIISTPPTNRYPIVTEVHTFGEHIIRDAITYEVKRGGQVFFIHNRVQNIGEVQTLLETICPDIKTVVAHGQMKGTQLEKIMLDFMSGKYDVLIATSIIESGLDISNANTIIINNAHHFGLSDLHQLRGRVGRSNKKAFCYLLAPPLSSLPQDSRRRLKAIEDFSELGSGFNIALQDLDIRGAGNLLGGEQSGFIADMGFETYQRILEEAMLELKENDFKDWFEEEEQSSDTFVMDIDGTMKARQSRKTRYVSDCQIDTDLEMLFPDEYITNPSERMRLYRELDSIQSEDELTEFEMRLTDRFGKIPKQSQDLISVVRLRWKAMDLGIEKFILKRQKLICHFGASKNSAFFDSKIFSQVLNYVNQNPNKCRFREGTEKLMIVFENVQNIDEAAKLLGEIE